MSSIGNYMYRIYNLCQLNKREREKENSVNFLEMYGSHIPDELRANHKVGDSDRDRDRQTERFGLHMEMESERKADMVPKSMAFCTWNALNTVQFCLLGCRHSNDGQKRIVIVFACGFSFRFCFISLLHELIWVLMCSVRLRHTLSLSLFGCSPFSCSSTAFYNSIKQIEIILYWVRELYIRAIMPWHWRHIDIVRDKSYEQNSNTLQLKYLIFIFGSACVCVCVRQPSPTKWRRVALTVLICSVVGFYSVSWGCFYVSFPIAFIPIPWVTNGLNEQFPTVHFEYLSHAHTHCIEFCVLMFWTSSCVNQNNYSQFSSLFLAWFVFVFEHAFVCLVRFKFYR